ncbi:hypothetical protein F3Y22_tig00113124pilonHSYRG00451 [Hibiscus syriacus]|uniref:START domain-containing protein n=1 Tax=Hibiscus syriacus TaxID=106335 RepID=A0A6A2WQ96_HIBSY|nr:hypothetical protein F3Y22_tig00113124pilonHSYRG00451 [Hibiscus syriacus]
MAMDAGSVACNQSWPISEDSLRRFSAITTAWRYRNAGRGLFISSVQWDPDMVEARYIKDVEDNLSIILLKFGQNSKPFFRRREFIVYERRETMEDGTLVAAVASLPMEIAAGFLPKQNNAIRGLLVQSGWVVEKLEDLNSCVVTYVVQLDPAGWLPKFFMNRLNTKLVMIIEKLRKLVQTTPPH